MSIPLLSNADLMAPSYGGVISSKTVELMAQQGNKLADTIEKQSYEFEARMKAPHITQNYSNAYQKIAQGDFTGFSDMQQARSMAMGNPILMKTIEEADGLAGKLANEWMTTQRTSMGIDKQSELQDRIDARQQNALAASETRQANSINAAADRQDASTSKSLFLAEHAAWEKEKFFMDKTYQDELKRYEKRVGAAKEEADLTKSDPVTIEKPEPPQYRKEPTMDDFRMSPSSITLPSAGVPDEAMPLIPDFTPTTRSQHGAGGPAPLPSQAVSAPAEEDNSELIEDEDGGFTRVTPDGNRTKVLPGLPKGKSSNKVDRSSKVEAGGMTNEVDLPMPEGDPDPSPYPPMIPGVEKSLVNQNTPSPTPSATPSTEPAPVHEQVAEKVAAGKPLEKLVVGLNPKTGVGMIVNIHPAGAKLEGVNVDTETGTVKKAYKLSHDEDKAQELVTHFASDENFAQWMAFQGRMGHQISFKQVNLGQKGDPVFIARTGSSEYQKKTLENGVEKRVPEHFSKEDAQKWEEMRGLMAKHVISVEHPPLADEAKQSFRNLAISDALGGNDKYNLEEANSQLKKLGVEPITEKDIESGKAKMLETVKTEQDKKRQSSMEKRAEAELAKKGLIDAPNGDAERQSTVANSEKMVKEIPAQISSLEADLKALASKSGGKLKADDLAEAKRLQIRIHELEDSLRWHSGNLTNANEAITEDQKLRASGGF